MERPKDIFDDGDAEWPAARAYESAGLEAMEFAGYLLTAGFSDDEAIEIGIAGSRIESPEEAANFIEAIARANGFDQPIHR